MRTLELPQGASCLQWGQAHGETFAAEIAGIAEIRTGLCMTVGGFGSREEVMALAKDFGGAEAGVAEVYSPPDHERSAGVGNGRRCSIRFDGEG